jgi:hypothetical protein
MLLQSPFNTAFIGTERGKKQPFFFLILIITKQVSLHLLQKIKI